MSQENNSATDKDKDKHTDAETDKDKNEQEPILVSRKFQKNLTLEQFEVGVTLGTGSFGRVRFATHKETNTYWAIKMLRKAEVVRLQQVEHILSEKSILLCLDHPFIVNFAGAFQDKKMLYMVLEYVCGGEIFSYLRESGRFDQKTARFYAAQVVLIFEYLHRLNFIYRDLKPENLLIDAEGFLKITDFGFAKCVTFKTYTLCGTPEYIAPEVLLNKGHGKGVDWWSLGVFLYEMLFGHPPFCDDDPMAIYRQILSGKFSLPTFFDRSAKSLIKKLLTADLTKRYGCMKNGAEDVKNHSFFAGINWEDLYARKVTPFIIPNVTTATDTSNFEQYPDSTDKVQFPVYSSGKDPFLDF